ncbi:uncharacterized protein A4U43_C06F16760 [Asparagus officinalis]|uniref:Uncharacterized protein n=1 Tax=Asparagus officinalis TaxID=4686 RepID=A0A5P1ESY7_ASPOF|nr:uncharacterized protein A4U43_C06F16760 [Asparagus officinalis]
MSGPDEPIKLRNVETFETAQAQNPIRQRPREMIRRNIETYKIPARANAAWYLAVQLVTSQIDIDQALTFLESFDVSELDGLVGAGHLDPATQMSDDHVLLDAEVYLGALLAFLLACSDLVKDPQRVVDTAIGLLDRVIN